MRTVTIIAQLMLGGLAFLLLFLGLAWVYLTYCNQELRWEIYSRIHYRYAYRVCAQLSKANAGIQIEIPDAQPPFCLGFDESFYPIMRSISLMGCPERNRILRNISPLKGIPFYSLELSRNDLTDLAPLRDMPLRELRLGSNRHLRDLSPLTGMTTLKSLYLSDTQVSDLTPLRGMCLDELWIVDTPAAKLTLPEGVTVKSLHIASDE